MSDTARVLIVGAGPTGLTLASALQAYGIRFSLIDRKAGPTTDSKGLALNMATQYGFELLGLGGVLTQSGCKIRRLNVYWQGQRLSAVDFRRLDSPLKHLITQRQAVTERQLIDALQTRGEAVHWHTTLTALHETAHGVTAQLSQADGRTQQQHFDYVIGCDGKSSTVRPHIGASLNGHDYPMYFVLGDFALQWDASPDQVHYHVHEDGFFILVPLGEGAWRVVVKYDGEIPPDLALDQARITAPVTARLGRNIFAADASWLSRAPFYSRVADQLQAGRIFLAGDAAHLFSPIGGTGMNTGIQDALNLGWKLAWVLRGLAPATLLDSYQQERLPAMLSAAATADRSTRLIARLDPNPALIDSLLPRMRNRPQLRQNLPMLHSGLLAAYPADTLLGHSPAAQAGQLCRWAGQARTRLHGEPLAPHLGLLVLAGPLGAQQDAVYALARRYAQQLVVASTQPCAAPLRYLAPFAGLPLAPGAAVFVRPDGFIGHSGTLAQLDEFSHGLASAAGLSQRASATALSTP